MAIAKSPIYLLVLGIKTMREFPVPAKSFFESDKLFRPTTPTHDVRGSSSPNLDTIQLTRDSLDEIVLLGKATDVPFQLKYRSGWFEPCKKTRFGNKNCGWFKGGVETGSMYVQYVQGI